MKIEVRMHNKKGLFHADGIYENGSLTVLKGSTLKPQQISSFKRAKQVLECRNDETVVKNNILLKDVTFKSPSTAAQLVTDASTNGYESWKCDNGKNLKEHLLELQRME